MVLEEVLNHFPNAKMMQEITRVDKPIKVYKEEYRIGRALYYEVSYKVENNSNVKGVEQIFSSSTHRILSNPTIAPYKDELLENEFILDDFKRW